jgi:hypothetical protein
MAAAMLSNYQQQFMQMLQAQQQQQQQQQQNQQAAVLAAAANGQLPHPVGVNPQQHPQLQWPPGAQQHLAQQVRRS